MPIWAYVYLFIVLAGTLYTFITTKQKSLWMILRDTISVVSCVALFLLAFEIIHFDQSVAISTLFLAFLIYSTYSALSESREDLSFYKMSAEEFAKTVELGKDETFEEAVSSIRILKYGSLVLMLALVLPVFYVYFVVVTNGS